LAPLRQEYLERISAPKHIGVNSASLLALQSAHLRSVPFENLDVRLGTPVEFHATAFVDKIVVSRRAGICYELNLAFAALLGSLGFGVDLLEARVYDGEGLGIPFDHVALRVEVDGLSMLADVGFGAFSDEPLVLSTVEQLDTPAAISSVLHERFGIDLPSEEVHRLSDVNGQDAAAYETGPYAAELVSLWPAREAERP
jgi:N-hydroxyarylamine O-acetyltransferase